MLVLICNCITPIKFLIRDKDFPYTDKRCRLYLANNMNSFPMSFQCLSNGAYNPSQKYYSRKTIDFTRKTFGFTRKTIGFTRETLDFTRKTFDFTRKTFDFTHKTVIYDTDGLPYTSAQTSILLLGGDFLAHHGLIVFLKHGSLVDPEAIMAVQLKRNPVQQPVNTSLATTLHTNTLLTGSVTSSALSSSNNVERYPSTRCTITSSS